VPDDQPVDERLVGTWVHSHEEDDSGGRVFRREGFPFPRSRGRVRVTLDTGGVLTQVGPGPDDRTRSVPGSWALHEGRQLTLRPEGHSEQTYVVELVEPDRLVLRPG
jgi:hypothetical protein